MSSSAPKTLNNLICMPFSALPLIEAKEAALGLLQGHLQDESQQISTIGISTASTRSSEDGFHSPFQTLNKHQFQSAKILPLHAHPLSPEAEAFIGVIRQAVIEWEMSAGGRQRKRRQKSLEKLDKALGTVLGGLLWNWGATQPRVSFRSLKTNDFTGEPVGAEVFKGVLQALLQLGLVLQHEGRRVRQGDSFSARYWPAGSLLRLAERYGLTPATLRQHFKLNPPKKAPRVPQLLQLKGAKVRGEKQTILPFDPATPEAARLIEQIKAMNRLAADTDVQGCLPPRWKRIFSQDWQHHGRWYAVGGEGNYQNLSQADRLQIQIGGEPVVEVDISASHLTLLHGMLGLPAPEGDAYAVEGIPRDVAKAWINSTIGKAAQTKRWSEKSRQVIGPNAKWTPIQAGKLILGRYPFLGGLAKAVPSNSPLEEIRRLLPHRLMFIEASIISRAMGDLAAQGILALPMHDGLIVAASAERAAHDAIIRAGWKIGEVRLNLKVDRPT